MLMLFSFGASAIAGENEIKQEVLNAFNYQFEDAKETEWTIVKDLYKVRFKNNGKWMFAFYNADAEWVASGRYISPCDLPDYLQKNLKKNYSSFWVAELFEINSSEGSAFYVTVENADKKVALESMNYSRWTLYKDFEKS